MSIQSECKVAREAMKALLLDGVEPCASHLAHLKECPSCRAIGEQALSLLSTEENPPTTPTPSLPELKAEVRHQAWRRLAIRAALTLGVAVAFLGTWALISWKSLVEFGGITFVILAASVIPVALVLALAQLPRKHRLYKRLCKGRQLSGVCLGLAEYTNTSAWFWRIGFLILGLILGPWTLMLYALLAMAMPIHPDDRAGLFRFKVARLFHRFV